MLDLLKDIHNKSEQMSGRKILVTFLVIFIVFLVLGIVIGDISSATLKESETQKLNGGTITQEKQSTYEGKIEYLNPAFYPNDNVSYELVGASGKQIVLLNAKDQKLSIAEGLFVKVKGTLSKTKDGKADVLNVSEVIIKNATN